MVLQKLFVVNISCIILQCNINNVIYCIHSIHTVWAFEHTTVSIFAKALHIPSGFGEISKQDH